MYSHPIAVQAFDANRERRRSCTFSTRKSSLLTLLHFLRCRLSVGTARNTKAFQPHMLSFHLSNITLGIPIYVFGLRACHTHKYRRRQQRSSATAYTYLLVSSEERDDVCTHVASILETIRRKEGNNHRRSSSVCILPHQPPTHLAFLHVLPVTFDSPPSFV